MNNIKFILALIALHLCSGLAAQSVPTPAPRQDKPVIIDNGTIHTGTGTVINGSILFEDGKIKEVGEIRIRPANSLVIDAAGKHIYPGLIAPVTHIGLDEIEAVRATDDKQESGEINPNARSIIAYNTDSRVTPTIRSNGVLLAQTVPDGPLFAGTSSVVQLDAWNWEDAAYATDDAVHLHWPSMNIFDSPWAPPKEKQKKNMEDRLAKIDQAMDDARSYMGAKAAGTLKKNDLRWEALVPVLKKEKSLFIYANTEKQILAAIAFKIKYDIKMVLVGGMDAFLLTDVLKEQNIPVILRQPHSLPRSEDDDIDQPFKTPALLVQEGILTCLSMESFWNTRNLAFQAGTASAHGLDPEVALQLITLNAAKILGIGDRTGSIEVGKDANILISDGDLLDMMSSNVIFAFIQGRQIDLGNKQKDLYEKFSSKYGNETK